MWFSKMWTDWAKYGGRISSFILDMILLLLWPKLSSVSLHLGFSDFHHWIWVYAVFGENFPQFTDEETGQESVCDLSMACFLIPGLVIHSTALPLWKVNQSCQYK